MWVGRARERGRDRQTDGQTEREIKDKEIKTKFLIYEGNI